MGKRGLIAVAATAALWHAQPVRAIDPTAMLTPPPRWPASARPTIVPRRGVGRHARPRAVRPVLRGELRAPAVKKPVRTAAIPTFAGC